MHSNFGLEFISWLWRLRSENDEPVCFDYIHVRPIWFDVVCCVYRIGRHNSKRKLTDISSCIAIEGVELKTDLEVRET